MKRASAVTGVVLGVVGMFATLASASPALAACQLVGGSDVRYPDAKTIFLGRVVGPGASPRFREVRVLEVYLGSLPRTVQMRNHASGDCLDLRRFMGRRVVFVRGVDPEYGPFTFRWFEAPRDGYWINMGAGQRSLGELLAYLGVRQLPATSVGPDASPAPRDGILPVSLTVTVMALLFAIRLRARARPI